MAEHKTKILIIEDDKFLVKALQDHLKRVGFVVVIAMDGEEGLKLIISEKPDLILLDLILPKKGGFEVLAEISGNSDDEIKSIPILILSNLGQESDLKKGLELGAVGYLIKTDFSMKAIVKKIKECLAKRKVKKNG